MMTANWKFHAISITLEKLLMKWNPYSELTIDTPCHYNDVTWTSKYFTSLAFYHLFNSLFSETTKKTSKFCITGPSRGETTRMISGCHSQRPSSFYPWASNILIDQEPIWLLVVEYIEEKREIFLVKILLIIESGPISWTLNILHVFPTQVSSRDVLCESRFVRKLTMVSDFINSGIFSIKSRY